MPQAEFNRQTTISAISNLSVGGTEVRSSASLAPSAYEVLYIYAPVNSICTLLTIQTSFAIIPGGVGTKDIILQIAGMGMVLMTGNTVNTLELVYGTPTGTTSFQPTDIAALNAILNQFMFDSTTGMSIAFKHNHSVATTAGTAERYCGLRFKKEMVGG